MRPTSEFLGSETLFGPAVIDWLWERRDRLPGMLIVVPTAQSGRLLREGLAEKGGVLAPRVVTSGYFLHTGEGASEAVETLAWVEVLEGIEDWTIYEAAFPTQPGIGEKASWSLPLAKSLFGVRAGLLEGGMMIAEAAERMGGSVEAERWLALADLERKVERILKSWGFESRSAIVSRGEIEWPAGVTEIVLAGLVDVSPAVVQVLESSPLPVRVLSGSDEGLDEWGRPDLEHWSAREISWPESGSVSLTGDPMQQAECALLKVATGGQASDQVTLGSVDEEVAAELVRTFGRAGWTIHNPGETASHPLAAWLSAWRAYLRRPEAAELMDLLSFKETGVLVKHRRVKRARDLSSLRNDYLVRRAEDVARVVTLLNAEVEAAGEERRAKYLKRSLEAAECTVETFANLSQARDRFLSGDFHEGMRSLLSVVDSENESDALEWLADTESVAKETKRPVSFWLEMLQSGIPPVSDFAPEERALDVQGWLELFFERGEHLVICGMNEGLLPARPSTDSWLPEGTRRVLELSSCESRRARDSYLLAGMIAAREASGRVDLLLGKSSGGGDVLQPSSLLLASKGKELARRVSELFKEVPPPEDGLSWTHEPGWDWQVKKVTPPERLSVTAFSDYLACPFRFYLKHVLKMQEGDPERIEWNARDFGTLVHLVLENFGRDLAARELSSENEIADWVHGNLEIVLTERLGSDLPAAIRIQKEVMRQRLSWFAECQAGEYADGWRIIEVEKNFKVEIGGIQVRGQIDRVEENLETGAKRVLDYKTKSKAQNVANAHGVQIRSNYEWPVHTNRVEEVKAVLGVGPRGKAVEARWINLQVPLYALAMGEVDEVGYFGLGATRSSVGLQLWPEFGSDEVEAARECAEWIVSQVKAGVFWPPAEKIKYDDYESLRFGKSLGDVINPSFAE
ncbi:PD-(D/E)XK nuclease family protein [Akkermansiaceae bacterium]|nr:PD-(D/E)XK nuclease family protein [Akkermansiaceae bacterium]MDA7887794.1 PD-(D/E)XK nuclease family protein [Akkermansiaceae bacterium]